MRCAKTEVAPAIVEIAGARPVSIEPVSASSPRATKTAPSIVWETSERDARDRARKEGRPLIVWARAEWAAAALQMERTTWTDARVAAAVRAFVALRLDLTDAESADASITAERYEIVAMPATVIFDTRGQRVSVLHGFADTEALLAALARAVE